MRWKDALLGVFVLLTIVFASVAAVENGRVTTTTSLSTVTSTQTTTYLEYVPVNSAGPNVVGEVSLVNASLTLLNSSQNSWELDMAVNVTGFDRPTTIQVFLDDAPILANTGISPGLFSPIYYVSCLTGRGLYGQGFFFPLGLDPCNLLIPSPFQWGLNSTTQTLDIVSGRTYTLRVEGLYAQCIQVPEVWATQWNGTSYNPLTTLVTYCGANYYSSLSNTLQVVAQ